MKMGNKRISIKEEIPRPMQCKVCLRFGHTKKRCKCDYSRCIRCGLRDHPQENCREPECCYNCNGPHHAFARECEHFKYHQEVLVRSLNSGISIRDAKQDMREEGKVLSPFSYLNALKPPGSNKNNPLSNPVQPEIGRPTPEFIPNTHNSNKTPVSQSNRFDALKDTGDEMEDVQSVQHKITSPKPQRRHKKRNRDDNSDEEISPSSQKVETIQADIHSPDVDESSTLPSLGSNSPPTKCSKVVVSPNSSQETLIFPISEENCQSPMKEQPNVTKPSTTKHKSLIHDYPMPGISSNVKLEKSSNSKGLDLRSSGHIQKPGKTAGLKLSSNFKAGAKSAAKDPNGDQGTSFKKSTNSERKAEELLTPNVKKPLKKFNSLHIPSSKDNMEGKDPK